MKKLASSVLLLLASTAIAPAVIAQTEEGAPDTRIEKYEDLTEPNTGSMTPKEELDSNYEAMESESAAEEADTRAEETLEQYQSQEATPDDYYRYDVRRTEAFNLVSSAYRGQFEEQGIGGYAVMVSNYNNGDLTAEDLIKAAIEAGELSPSAMDDESYVRAVEFQLQSLRNS
jgi:hypothetical protein